MRDDEVDLTALIRMLMQIHGYSQEKAQRWIAAIKKYQGQRGAHLKPPHLIWPKGDIIGEGEWDG